MDFDDNNPQLGLDSDLSGSGDSPPAAPAPAEAPHPPIDFSVHPGEVAKPPPPGALDDAFGHYAEPPAPAAKPPGGPSIPLGGGVDINKKGIGFKKGDWDWRYWPENDYVKKGKG